MSFYVFLNNELVPEEKAFLHFRDLSIQRGYGVFDFFKVVKGIPVFLEEHLNRFYFSAEQMRLNIGYGKEELKTIIEELLQKNKIASTGVRLSLTGGYSADGYQLTKPNLIISLHSFTEPTQEQYKKGIRLISYQHQRQLPHIKTIDYLMAIWLQDFVKQKQADDVLYHQNGIISECPRSNLFMVTKDKTIVTPARNILKGIVRMKLIETAKAGFKVEERDLTINELKTAAEVFITSTTKTILPVRQIDEHILRDEHPVSFHLQRVLTQLERSFMQAL